VLPVLAETRKKNQHSKDRQKRQIELASTALVLICSHSCTVAAFDRMFLFGVTFSRLSVSCIVWKSGSSKRGDPSRFFPLSLVSHRWKQRSDLDKAT
jgi:hypothetical protein